MSQQFQRDAVSAAGPVTVTTTNEITILTGNPLTPPFGTCKGAIIASCSVITGAGTTAITMRIRRNPSTENVVVATSRAVASLSNGVDGFISLGATDQIPDGRSVTYAVTLQQTGGAANATANGISLDATLISG
jgi:hypothetical protein